MMEVTRERHLMRLFMEAADLEGDDRAAYLERLDDPRIRQRLEHMLDSDRHDRFLTESVPVGLNELEEERDREWIGSRLGPYRIRRLLGRGGMSCVFVADRVDGEFHREVAIKVLRSGVHSREERMRFQQEKQILADLHHPQVAGLIDGGTTPGGVPYVVMELVSGEAITRYCDRNRLGIVPRLNLFVQACRAVSYAHRNMVIHRDIKPGNIMVDQQGRLKLLDFGIAKLMQPWAEPMTGPSDQPMTPSYASPEQRSGESITAASDIYSLGVLLVELIKGTRKLDESDWASEQVAMLRSSSVGRIKRQLAAGLDAMIQRATAPAPEQRYPSVNRLIGDVEAYLAGHGVGAGWWKRMRTRMIARRGWFAGMVALALVTIGSSLVAVKLLGQLSSQRQENSVLRERSRQVTDILLSSFEIADPIRSDGGRIQSLDVLDAGVKQAGELSSQPDTQALLYRALGLRFQQGGYFQRAERCFADAAEIWGRLPDREGDRLEAQQQLARTRLRMGNTDAGLALIRRVLQGHRALHGEPSETVAQDLSIMALLLRKNGELDAAESAARRGLEMMLGLKAADDPDTLHGRITLLQILDDRGRYRDCVELGRDSLDLALATYGEYHTDVATARSALGYSLFQLGLYDEAQPLLRRALELNRRLHGEQHPDVANSLTALGDLYDRVGDYHQSESFYRQAIELHRLTTGTDQEPLAVAHNNMAVMMYHRGDYQHAERQFRQALGIRERIFPPDHVSIGQAWNNMAGVLQVRGRYREASDAYQRALVIHLSSLGPEHPETATTWHNLAWIARNLHDPDLSEAYYRRVLRLRSEVLSNDHPLTAMTRHNLGWLLLSSGRLDEAYDLLSETLRTRSEVLGSTHPRTAESRIYLADLLLRTGEIGSARRQLDQAIPVLARAYPVGHWQRIVAQHVDAFADSLQGGDIECMDETIRVLESRPGYRIALEDARQRRNIALSLR